MKKSYVKKDLLVFVIGIVASFVVSGVLLGILAFLAERDIGEEFSSIVGLGYIFSVIFYAIYNYSKYSSKCPKCREYSYIEVKSEDLSRDVIQEIKYEKDGNGIERQKIYNYAVGKRKHYYKCSECGYESTTVREYKDKIK